MRRKRVDMAKRIPRGRLHDEDHPQLPVWECSEVRVQLENGKTPKMLQIKCGHRDCGATALVVPKKWSAPRYIGQTFLATRSCAYCMKVNLLPAKFRKVR